MLSDPSKDRAKSRENHLIPRETGEKKTSLFLDKFFALPLWDFTNREQKKRAKKTRKKREKVAG
jgi:diadenosine tetraphosphate (Ap4A) HIT family hydrolase